MIAAFCIIRNGKACAIKDTRTQIALMLLLATAVVGLINGLYLISHYVQRCLIMNADTNRIDMHNHHDDIFYPETLKHTTLVLVHIAL